MSAFYGFWLLAAGGGEHGGEQDVSEVIMHHLANQPVDNPALAALGVSKGVIMMILAAGFLVGFLGWFLRRERIAQGPPKGITNALEAVVVFVRDEIAVAHIGRKYGLMFTPFLLTLGLFILTCNLLGLVPGGYTATGNINVTATLALITLVTMVSAGMIVQGPIGYFKHMIPPGTPTAVVPLLIFIELISTLVKPIALTIRLGANMSAGHIVILVMLSFIFIFESVLVGLFISVPLAVGINLLEMIVAIVQAYVFTLLTAVYIGMVVHTSH